MNTIRSHLPPRQLTCNYTKLHGYGNYLTTDCVYAKFGRYIVYNWHCHLVYYILYTKYFFIYLLLFYHLFKILKESN
jgi:hypothetical protein